MWIGMARVGSGRNECCTGVVLCGRSECGDAGWKGEMEEEAACRRRCGRMEEEVMFMKRSRGGVVEKKVVAQVVKRHVGAEA